ncbi:MAG: ExeA family protein [Burkholderiales bacterium]
MYYEHFGLHEAPFKITPNTDFFFTGGNRGPVLDALIYAITNGDGIVKVTGEVGSGKTMLCNMLQSRLPDDVERVYLANPNVAPVDVLHAIAFDLLLGVDRGTDRLELIHVLQDCLVSRHAEGKRVVLFIEESQSMPLATLEEIRMLSNLETRTDKLLQIVLFGQPELDERLRRHDIRQLRDRIAHSFRLEPLTAAEVREYLTFRMRAAGYRGPDIFSPAVVAQIAKASSGLTRRINLIADKALLAAFSENTHSIAPRHVQAALRDSEFGHASRRRWRAANVPAYAWTAMALVAGTVLGAGVYAMLTGSAAPATAQAADAAPRAALPAPPAADAAPPTPTVAVGAAVAATITPVVASGESALNRPAERASADSAASTGDVIAGRLDATRKWLSSNPPNVYTIQLLVTPDESQLRSGLRMLPKFIETDDLYMYRALAHGRPAVNVMWGSFLNREAAEEGLEALPGFLRANRPYVRTLGSVHADIERQAAWAVR